MSVQPKDQKIMKPLMVIVADYASVEVSTGKLNILGAFRRIWAAKFPAKHRAMSLVTKIGGEMGDTPNPHTMSVSLTDEDGNELLQISGAFNMPHNEPGIQPEFNAVMEFRDVVFQRPGTYSFFLKVDDEILEQTAIQVTLSPNPPPVPPQG